MYMDMRIGDRPLRQMLRTHSVAAHPLPSLTSGSAIVIVVVALKVPDREEEPSGT